MAFDAVRPALVLSAAKALNPVFFFGVPVIPARVPTLDAAVVPFRHDRAPLSVLQATMTAHRRKLLPQRLVGAQVDIHQVPNALPVLGQSRKLEGIGGLPPRLVEEVLLPHTPDVCQTLLVQGLHRHGLRHDCSATSEHQESCRMPKGVAEKEKGARGFSIYYLTTSYPVPLFKGPAQLPTEDIRMNSDPIPVSDNGSRTSLET